MNGVILSFLNAYLLPRYGTYLLLFLDLLIKLLIVLLSTLLLTALFKFTSDM